MNKKIKELEMRIERLEEGQKNPAPVIINVPSLPPYPYLQTTQNPNLHYHNDIPCYINPCGRC
jgi:hypothetical protein